MKEISCTRCYVCGKTTPLTLATKIIFKDMAGSREEIYVACSECSEKAHKYVKFLKEKFNSI